MICIHSYRNNLEQTFLNQVHAKAGTPGSLIEIAFICKVCVCLCMCVCPLPRLHITIHVKRSPNNQSNKSYTFQFLIMTLAVDITDGCGLSNKVCCESLPKKSKVMLYLPFITQYKAFIQLYITKTEHFSFKSGCAMRVVKLIKEDWPIVLR